MSGCASTCRTAFLGSFALWRQAGPWAAGYQPALRLADIVLRHGAAKPGEAGLEVASFVVVMWKVFEDFVTVALTEALAYLPGRTQAQLPAFLAGLGDWQRARSP